MDFVAAFAITSVITLIISIPFSVSIIRYYESGQYQKDVENGVYNSDEW